MDDRALESADPRAQIELLEERIEQLSERIESCRKFIAASRLAVTLGGVLLLAMLVRVLPFDALTMAASITGVLGGIVLSGSNRSTRQEAEAQMAQAEATRAELIGRINLHVVGGTDTLH
jgi:hypothetical protein